jgi:hypothetical protein
MKPTTILLMLFAIVVFAWGCKKIGSGRLPTIYVVGNLETGVPNKTLPILWKNGVPTDLSNSSAGGARAIVLHNNDVFVGGYLINGTRDIPVVWKNGIAIIQQVPLPNANANVFGLIVKDTIVYACGYYLNYLAGNYMPVIWENGKITFLEAPYGAAYSIFLSGNDIYVGGELIDSNSTAQYPVIWKNRKIMFSRNDNGCIRSIWINGSDIYAAGSLIENQDVPVIWKNGIMKDLNYTGGDANNIFVKNNDVYVSGTMNNTAVNKYVATIWKNNEISTNAGINVSGTITKSLFYNNDFYAIGNRYDVDSSGLRLWKNGKDTLLYHGYGTLYDIAIQ